jgi:NADP-dependent 3-hydroxy acid dehydrogenase YdfG
MAAKSNSKSRTPEAQSVAGRRVLITGGSTGIGRATALLLAAEGARVLICGRKDEILEDAMADLKEVTSEASAVAVDLAEPAGVEELFATCDRYLGELDVLINNAALAADSITEGNYDDWRYVVHTNLLGYMACAHNAAARMKKRSAGHIVNVGSMSADVREEGSSVYVATKAGIQGFSEALRKEVNKDGIKVTLIEPGAVGTDMQPESPSEQRTKQKQLEMLTAEDIAACIHYCLQQPKRCDVVDVKIRPHMQMI